MLVFVCFDSVLCHYLTVVSIGLDWIESGWIDLRILLSIVLGKYVRNYYNSLAVGFNIFLLQYFSFYGLNRDIVKPQCYKPNSPGIISIGKNIA